MLSFMAILVSFAMMLTGVGGTAGEAVEPVARVLTISNVVFTVNDETVALNPTASIGVRTDGIQAAYDFHIDSNGMRLLPFQLVADEDGLLVYSGNSRTTVDLTSMIDEAMSDMTVEVDPEAQAVLEFMSNELLPAYRALFELGKDPDQVAALNDEANRVFAEIVDRGEGVPGTAEYDGETYAVTTYEYTLDGEQVGRLVDAIYGANEVLSNYAAAYFKLLSMVGEDSGLSGVDSFQALLAATGVDMRFDIVESVSENGLDVTDGAFTFTVLDMDLPPFRCEIHSIKLGERSEAAVSFDMETDGVRIAYDIEATGVGSDLDMTMAVRVDGIIGYSDGPAVAYEDKDANDGAETAADVASRIIAFANAARDRGDKAAHATPLNDKSASEASGNDEASAFLSGNGPTADADAASAFLSGGAPAADADEAVPEDPDTDAAEAAPEAPDAEPGIDDGASPASFELVMHVASATDAETGDRNVRVAYELNAMDAANGSFSLEGVDHADGSAEYGCAFDMNADGVYFALSFDANVTTDLFPVNADRDSALPADEAAATAIGASAVADVLNLSVEPSVKQLVDLFTIATDYSVETVYDGDDDYGYDYDDDDDYDEPVDDGKLAFGIPQFAWLPDGCAVVNLDIDTQYDIVYATIRDAATGNMLSIYFDAETQRSPRFYLPNGSGDADEYNGIVISAITYDDGTVYVSATDGYINIEAYPGDFPIETVVKILANVRY